MTSIGFYRLHRGVPCWALGSCGVEEEADADDTLLSCKLEILRLGGIPGLPPLECPYDGPYAFALPFLPFFAPKVFSKCARQFGRGRAG